ncbi:hypothetical protein Pcinc_011448 [Petrolisthes cinctipes]|uniref:Uncharacterized protein n=1 Tax=Petrolisthes cinctipes TaxID=88211 RepID=A0AAE1G6V0_PETCI|nr:hypothetical protein Pcinc_011448 [Petrolisthes cinctipes]
MKVKIEDCTDEDVIVKVEHDIDEDDERMGMWHLHCVTTTCHRSRDPCSDPWRLTQPSQVWHLLHQCLVEHHQCCDIPAVFQ